MVQPIKAKTFDDYVTHYFIPYISSAAQGNVSILDLVWDTYPEDSLKLQTQEKRGSGSKVARTIVKCTTPVPTSWKHFLQNSENKVDLFRYLSDEVTQASAGIHGIQLYATKDDTVLVSATVGRSQSDLQRISPCSHQEADGRMFLHVLDASREGHSKVMVRTVDSDVVVIVIGIF